MPQVFHRGIGLGMLVLFLALPPSPCRQVVVTRHDAMPAVLRNKPERICPPGECDGYIAPFDCRLLGNRYVMVLGGETYRLKATDCSVWGPTHPKLEGTPDWFGDVWLADPVAHASINAPRKVLLCYSAQTPKE